MFKLTFSRQDIPEQDTRRKGLDLSNWAKNELQVSSAFSGKSLRPGGGAEIFVTIETSDAYTAGRFVQRALDTGWEKE